VKNLFYSILSFLLVLGLASCDEEVKQKVKSVAEKNYLEDYFSPDYLWGYIDLKGNEVIPAIYDDVRDFREGLAAVNYKGYWGFIDEKGKFAIAPIYRTVQNFSEGFAIVQTFNDSLLLIDKIGQIIQNLPAKEAFSVSSQIIRIKNNQGYTFLDLGGNPINQEVYDKAFDFNNDIAIVGIEDKMGVINTSGIEILPLNYLNVASVNGHFLKVKNEDNHYQLFNIAERKFIAGSFRTIISSGDQGIAVLAKQDNWLIYNEKSNENIQTNYSKLYSGGEGKWFFRKDGKFGILDSLGNLIADDKFDALYRYSEKRCVYQRGEFWGYLKDNGEELTPPLFPLAWDFRNRRARIIANGGIGFIDTVGSLVVPNRFIEVRDFYEGYARFQKIR
jgi:hypothetical protein